MKSFGVWLFLFWVWPFGLSAVAQMTAVERGYRIDDTQIHLRIDFEAQRVYGEAMLTLRRTDHEILEALIDARDLKVSRVRVNGRSVRFRLRCWRRLSFFFR